MEFDGYGAETAVGEIDVVKLVKGEVILLQRKLSTTFEHREYTYSWAKTLALEYELDEKVKILVGDNLRDIVRFISGLLQSPPNDLGGTFVRPQYALCTKNKLHRETRCIHVPRLCSLRYNRYVSRSGNPSLSLRAGSKEDTST